MGFQSSPIFNKFSVFCCCLRYLVSVNSFVLKPSLLTKIKSNLKAYFENCDLHKAFAIAHYFDISCHIILPKLIETSIKAIWLLDLNHSLLVGMQSKG